MSAAPMVSSAGDKTCGPFEMCQRDQGEVSLNCVPGEYPRMNCIMFEIKGEFVDVAAIDFLSASSRMWTRPVGSHRDINRWSS